MQHLEMEVRSGAKEQTLSLRLVMDPITEQIAELEKLVNSRKTGFPDLVPAAVTIRSTVCKLHQQIKVDLPLSCDMAVKASEQLVEAAKRLRQQPSSHHSKALLLRASQDMKTAIIQVLLHWDGAEVRQICAAAQIARDRLKLMSGSKSMRSLLLCFKGYAESMKVLLIKVDKRQKELVDKERKQRLLRSLDKIKNALPRFSSAMQTYVRTQTPISKEAKDNISEEIAKALDELMESVQDYGSSSMARNIVEVKRKLGTSKRYSIGPELDRHIDAIIENSKAVAHVSHDEYRETILKECGEVLNLRKELGAHYEAVSADPGSAKAKRAFDKCSKKLCKKLNELDRWVADSVVDQVTDVFVETAAPIDHLLHAATAQRRMVPAPPTSAPPAPPPSATDSPKPNIALYPHTIATYPRNIVSYDSYPTGIGAAASVSPTREQLKHLSPSPPPPPLQDTKHMAELFRRHSNRLSEVAAYVAQSSTNPERIKQIKDLASSVDKLTSTVVEKAEDVSRNTQDIRAQRELDTLRRKWASEVKQLTQIIDDIIDPSDFMAKSETNIRKDMERCQSAIHHRKWEELRRLVVAIAAKARRALEVGETTVSAASDHAYKIKLSSAVAKLEQAIPKTAELIKEPANQERQKSFLKSTENVLHCLQHIQSVLDVEIDITSEEEEDISYSSQSSPTPLQSQGGGIGTRMTAQERLTKRNVNRTQSRPQYIGRLGSSRPRTLNRDQQDEVDSGPQDQHSLSFSDSLGQSYDSGTQTSRFSVRDQSSQVDDHYFSTNATRGSQFTPSVLSPESSTSTWKTPPSPVPLSPVRHAPLSPDKHTPPRYTQPPSYSPPVSPERVPHRPAPPSPTEVAMSSYVPPFRKLVSAVEKGNQQEVSSQASNLSARVIRLTELASSAASTLNDDTDLVRVIRSKSSEISKLTPRILDQADLVSRNPHLRQQQEEFQAVTHQWAGNVRDLINATQKANHPWSQRAKQLLQAAETGDGLQSQMEHISTQTGKMVDVAHMAIKAAMTEEAIGGTGDPDQSVDRELQEQVKLVRTKLSEIEKLTPQLLGAAEMAAGQPVGEAASEHLHLLAQEWATNAKVLMKGVDDITLGMGGAADTLFLSAKSGDEGLQMEQTEAIKNFASSLQAIANEAVEGCDNQEKVRVVRVVARRVDKLSLQLVECAGTVAEAMEGGGEEREEEGGEEGGPSQTIQENTEILRRDWSSQVHLLTAHIDDLTADVSAPLDRLVELSLQANRTSGYAKHFLIKKFEDMAQFMVEQLNHVGRLFTESTGEVGNPEPAVKNAKAAISFLKKLTPHAIGAAKSLESEAGSAMLEHFNHLRRQWAAKAQFLVTNLKRITMVNVTEVIDAFVDLLHDSRATSPKVDQSDLSDYSNLSSQSESLSLIHRSYSSEVIGDTTPVTRFDFEESELKAPSTPLIESRPKKKQHIPALSEMGLRPVTPRIKRPTSMAVPLPSWAVGDSAEDTNSADSIALAAQSLRELTEEFLEENNPLVTVGKKMSEQMSEMAEFTRGKGDLHNKTDMILTAKAVAANGKTIHRIASVICRQCVDERSRNNLLCCAEMIPTLSTQLTILASVKTSTPDDISADVMLVKNAQNLMQAVIKTVQAAEAACMKGLEPMETEGWNGGEDQQPTDFTMSSWKRKLYHQRAKETINAPGGKGAEKAEQVSHFYPLSSRRDKA